jgi:hypothetical protein
MKILDMTRAAIVINSGEECWESPLTVLGNARPDVYIHTHCYHHSAIEWRIAEYAMDPNDIDAVLHLILHEHLLNRRTEVTCYTSGYTPQEALAHRLAQIQEHIAKHEARMTDAHNKMIKHEPHKHPGLDPVREQGVREDKLHVRQLHVRGIRQKLAGNYTEGQALLEESKSLFALERMK